MTEKDSGETPNEEANILPACAFWPDGMSEMTCRYCGTRNDEGEHRCIRCGRRPGDTLNTVPAPVMTGATAPRLQPVAQVHFQPEESESAERAAPDLGRAYQ